MIFLNNANQFKTYISAKKYFEKNHTILIEIEKYISSTLISIIINNILEIKNDYNEASYLFPFWKNYPPDDRGRQPIKDQYPWIEVGEHAIGAKISRLLVKDFIVRDHGLPAGPDQRFVLKNDFIKKISNGLTDSIWLFIDIKSVGPRDDQHHTVMSHNQVSGDGLWHSINDGIINTILKASGKRNSHDFHASIPPLYVLSDNTILPVVMIALKPVYKMIRSKDINIRNEGQPLERIDVATIPNGILLTITPNYLNKYPGLLFPGKDDKSKDPRKLRARVCFKTLKLIDNWRIKTVNIP